MTILDLLAQRGLSPVKTTNMHGGEYVSPCPKCGGSDCFRVWPALNAQDREGDTWFCRRCSQGGDLKKFLQVFGEDSVDETEKKIALMPEDRAEWHILHAKGYLQSATDAANPDAEIDEILTNLYRYGKRDGSREAEAENARLRAERDWLAENIADRPCAYDSCPFGLQRPTGPDDDDCDKTRAQCWQEAARRAVGESK